jgi:DmsE family decaheme c-type cytochrome
MPLNDRRGSRVRLRVTLALFALAWTAAVVVSASGRSSSAGGPALAASGAVTVTAQTPAPAQGPGFVGDDTCVACHESEGKTLGASLHGKAQNVRTPAAKVNQACETCHGPGREHAESGDVAKIVNPAKLPPQRASETCATCHDRSSHALWSGSQHDSRNVGCVTCHSVHTPKGPTQLKAVSEPPLCASCHRDKVAKLDRSGHMPVREGKMQCSTCHNPHGATNVKLLRRGDSIAEACTSCHADKRGPYLWEHAPSRDGCTTCHDPHGSSNERMLVSKPPILCQRCHVGTRHPSTIYDAGLIGAGATPSIRIYARSCVTCHSAIHGSNHPSGQRFIR